MLDYLKNRDKKGKSIAKVITPNNKLYVLLLLAAAFLTVISLSIKEYDAYFTIWTSISCGGIASVLVAWLIDAVNCRQASRKILENRAILFANLYHVFDNGLQLLVFECAKAEHCENSKRWYEWVDNAFQQVDQHPEMVSPLLRCLIVFFDDIGEQVFAIKSQEAMLLDSGIICPEDIQSLSTMQTICETARITYRSKNSDGDCFQSYKTDCALLRKLVDFAPTLRPINDAMVEPSLYLMGVKAGVVASHKESSSEDKQ